MMNFRFHLVSLIAVFLALGLGILVGSTVVDQKIVNRLDSEISSVRKENSARKAANEVLAKTNSQLQDFIDDSSPFAADARLDGLSIAVIAERGIDGDVVKKTEDALRGAGADVPGILWLDDSWQLDTETRSQALQTALGLTANGLESRDAAFDLLARRLIKAPPGASASTSTSTTAPGTTTSSSPATSGPTTSTTRPASRVDVLAELEQAGFLSVTDGEASGFDAFPTRVVDVLVITGDDSHFAGTDFTASFVRALVRAKLPTVVAAEYEPGNDPADAPERGAALAPILEDNALSRTVSTVDDLELTQGRLASVLALEVIGSDNVGHYGYGPDASAPLPPHRS